MRKMRNFWTVLSVISIVFLFMESASAELIVDSNYELVGKSRASRTEYDYTYQANITNSGPTIEVNVIATLSSSSENTTIIDGDVTFGNVSAGNTVAGVDTFTIRQDRRYSFDPASLVWEVTSEKLRIKNVSPDAALPGETVAIEYSGAIDGVALEAVLSGKIVSTSEENINSVKLLIPNEVKSGPLFIKQGSRVSNSVWLNITETISKIPSPDKIVNDEFGNEIAVNLVIISLKNGFVNDDEANRVAALVGGKIVGKVPLVDGYQVEINTVTLDELREAINILKSDVAVDFVLTEIVSGIKDAWFDPGIDGQRESNNTEKGAELYRNNVDPSDDDKIHPLFTSIGIVEDGIDFDVADFDGYADLNRPNNIAIYSKDVTDYHGINVTGIIAAEANDSSKKTGKNSGFLQALGNKHGGFNIRVEAISSTSNLLNKMEEMMKKGTRVFNWSLGLHKKGAKKSDGTDVDNNVFEENDFNNYKKGFEKVIKKIENWNENNSPIVIICSAGNGDTLVDPEFRTPSAIDSDVLIVVGAHTYDKDGKDRKRYYFSDYGSRVDISTAGKIMEYDGGSGLGTSYSTPLVTSVVSAILSINPDLSPKEIVNILRSSAYSLENNEVTLSSGGKEVFTTPLTAEEVGEGDDRIGKGACLNIEGAIQAAIDSVGEKTIPKGDKVEVTLPKNTSVSVPVQVTVPEDDVFNKVDIIFMVDVSGSYGDDITQFKSKAVDIVNAFESAGRDVHIGLTTFSDFPFSPYGSYSSGDYAYRLDLPLTNEFSNVISAINGISLHYGMDGPESQLEALYQAATGAGRTVPSRSYSDIPPSSVGWRSGSLPIIFLATDYSFHKESSYPGASWSEALSALTSRGIRVYGLQAGGYISDVVNMASATGGESFTLSRNSSEIIEAVLAALESASSKVDIKLVPNGDFADIIQSISPEKHEDAEPGETKIFDVMFTRSLSLDSGVDHVFAFRLEVIAEDVAIIMEIPVTVSIPAE